MHLKMFADRCPFLIGLNAEHYFDEEFVMPVIDSEQSNIRIVHTLGPGGTNCEAAASLWIKSNGHLQATTILHGTLEEALEGLLRDPDGAVLLGCVVYPNLHELVFNNLERLTLVDQFIMPTFNMLLASRGQEIVRTVASHPAPRSLLNGRGLKVTESTSNSKAAELCRDGLVDACITTLPAAEAYGLTVLEDFGPVPMGFTIHAPKSTA